MGVETFIQPADIINANKKLLLAFCAQLFNTNPNLTVEVRSRHMPSVHALSVLSCDGALLVRIRLSVL